MTRTAGRWAIRPLPRSGLGLPFPGAFPLWSYTPGCADGHPYLGFSGAISEPGGVLLQSFSTNIAVRDAALAFVDCAVMAVAVFPDAHSRRRHRAARRVRGARRFVLDRGYRDHVLLSPAD